MFRKILILAWLVAVLSLFAASAYYVDLGSAEFPQAWIFLVSASIVGAGGAVAIFVDRLIRHARAPGRTKAQVIGKILFCGWSAALVSLLGGCAFYVFLFMMEYAVIGGYGGDVLRYSSRRNDLLDKATVLFELALYAGVGGGAIVLLVWLFSRKRRPNPNMLAFTWLATILSLFAGLVYWADLDDIEFSRIFFVRAFIVGAGGVIAIFTVRFIRRERTRGTPGAQVVRKLLFWGWSAAFLGLFAGGIFDIFVILVGHSALIQYGGDIGQYWFQQIDFWKDRSRVLFELALYVGAGGGAISLLLWSVDRVRGK